MLWNEFLLLQVFENLQCKFFHYTTGKEHQFTALFLETTNCQGSLYLGSKSGWIANTRTKLLYIPGATERSWSYRSIAPRILNPGLYKTIFRKKWRINYQNVVRSLVRLLNFQRRVKIPKVKVIKHCKSLIKLKQMNKSRITSWK